MQGKNLTLSEVKDKALKLKSDNLTHGLAMLAKLNVRYTTNAQNRYLLKSRLFNPVKFYPASSQFMWHDGERIRHTRGLKNVHDRLIELGCANPD